jgi:hypothetical protein
MLIFLLTLSVSFPGNFLRVFTPKARQSAIPNIAKNIEKQKVPISQSIIWTNTTVGRQSLHDVTKL